MPIDDDDRQRRRKKLQPGLRPPVGQRGLRPGGRDDQDRKMHQRPDRADLVFRHSRAGEASRDVAVQRQRALKRGDLATLRPISLSSLG